MNSKDLYTGSWFLPENPDRKVFGSMSLSEEGKPVLLVFEKFRETNVFEFDKIEQITGHVFNQLDRKTYTIELINVFQTSNTTGPPNFYFESTEYLIVEGLYTSSHLKFKDIYLHTDILNDWIKSKRNIKVIDYETKFTAECTYAEVDELYKDDDVSIYAYSRGGYTFKSNRTATLSESKWINVELKNEVDMLKLHRSISSMENLFTLLFNHQAKFTSIELRDIEGTTYKHYYAGRKDNFITNRTARQGVDFKNFTGNSQAIIGDWFKKQDELRLIVNNFFAAYGNSKMYNEDRYTTYISILEQYHKLRYNNYKPKEDPEYIRKSEKVLSKLDGEDFDFVKARLVKNKEVRLQTRLKDLNTRFSLNYTDETIRKFVNTRNYYVHLDRSKSDIYNGTELNDINVGIGKAIFSILHKEIGIEESPKKLRQKKA